MIIALKWLWMTLNWPQMYVFWKYTQSNADSHFLMHNNKKSIEIDFLFGIIRVLRVFLREKFFLKLRSFQAKKLRSIFEIIIPFLWLSWAWHFRLFMTKRLFTFWGWQEGLKSKHFKARETFAHFKMKGKNPPETTATKSFQNERSVNHFKTKVLPKINLLLI